MNRKLRLSLIAAAMLTAFGCGGYLLYKLQLSGQKPAMAVAQKAQPEVVKPVAPKPKEVPKAADIIKATNDYRAAKGLAPLTENAKLDQSACLKAQDMVTKDYWAHNAPDGTMPRYWFNQAGYMYKAAGENLAYGFQDSSSLVKSWVQSPTHEANLSGNYSDVGVCVKESLAYQGGENTLIVAHYGMPE